MPLEETGEDVAVKRKIEVAPINIYINIKISLLTIKLHAYVDAA